MESWEGNKQISLIIHSPCRDVWIIRVWATDSKGLFCPTGVKCNFPLYRVIGVHSSKVVCSIGSHSHFVLMAIWHSKITAQWPSQPYNIKILYFANAPLSQSHLHQVSVLPREISCFLFMPDNSYHGDILRSPDISCQSYGNLSSWMHAGLLNTVIFT